MSRQHPGFRVSRQMLRYGVVGVAQNGVAYALYLGATWLGMAPKVAMSVLYFAAMLLSFYLNRSWTFRYGGLSLPAFFRCLVAYGVGYAVNLSAMVVMVGKFGYPHELVQGAMIFVVGGVVFLLFKLWVFREAPVREPGECC